MPRSVNISVQYQGNIGKSDWKGRERQLRTVFQEVAPVLELHQATLDMNKLAVSGQSAPGFVPETEFDDLAADLKKRCFRLDRLDKSNMLP